MIASNSSGPRRTTEPRSASTNVHWSDHSSRKVSWTVWHTLGISTSGGVAPVLLLLLLLQRGAAT
jgi:hypothetical protein